MLVPGPSLDAGKASCRVKNLTNTIHSACVRSRDLHGQRLHFLIFDFSSPISPTFLYSPASDSPPVQHSQSIRYLPRPISHSSIDEATITSGVDVSSPPILLAIVVKDPETWNSKPAGLRTLIAWGSSIQKQPTAPPNAIAAVPYLRPQVLATTKQLDVPRHRLGFDRATSLLCHLADLNNHPGFASPRAAPAFDMSPYSSGGRAPNVSHFLRDLNTVKESSHEDNFTFEEDLAVFTNSSFFDFETGQQTDYQAQPAKPETETQAPSSAAAEDLTSPLGEFGNVDFSLPGEPVFSSFWHGIFPLSLFEAAAPVHRQSLDLVAQNSLVLIRLMPWSHVKRLWHKGAFLYF